MAEGTEGDVRGEAEAGHPGVAQQQLEIIREQCQDLLARAVEARAYTPPGREAGPYDLRGGLVTARGQLDRLEFLLIQAITLRDALVVRAAKLEQAADDAWDDEARKHRGRTPEFEGAQERYAAWRIKVRKQREEARLAREGADWAVSTERRIDRMYRGLDGSRQDIHKRIAALAYENHLDR